MIKRMILMLLAIGLLIAAVVAFNEYKSKLIGEAMLKFATAPQTVSTETVAYADWQDTQQAVGTLRARRGVDISSEVAGVVDEITFTSGTDAPANEVLFRLRLNDNPGRLKQLEAAVELAQITLRRDQQQVRAQAIAQSTVDTDIANLKSAQAQVEQQKAIIEQRMIRAPFDGRLGIRQVDLGQYVSPGTALITLQQLDPIYLDFTLPQQSFGLVKVGQDVTVLTDAYPGRTFTGAVQAIESKVDSNTRNITIRAEIQNADKSLLPGMYATATIKTGAPRRLLTIRQTSVAFNAYGSTAFIVQQGKDSAGKARQTVEQAFITTGPTLADRVAVLTGLKEGDTIVTAGQIKLRNGSEILVNNTIQPTNDATVKPGTNR